MGFRELDLSFVRRVGVVNVEAKNLFMFHVYDAAEEVDTGG